MNKEPIAVFQTSDMPLVAFLRYKGYTVQKITKLNDWKCEFTFNDVDRDMLDDFQTDKTIVEPRQFSSIMHQQIQAAKHKLRE